MEREPKVTLIRWTPNPIGAINAVWYAAKTDQPLEDILKETPCNARINPEMAVDLFKKVIAMEIPVAEFVNFVFTFEDVPIYWREQLVRQRKASYWSQSHRILDLSRFSEDQLYYIPKSIRNDVTKREYLNHCMAVIGDTYNKLVHMGVPMEDARAVIPMCATHRISMQLDLKQLIYVIKERSCHILQGSIWKPIIDQMIKELETKVDPVFKMLRNPICFRNGEFIGCRYHHDNERRVEGKDKLPPCCIWVQKEGLVGGNLPDPEAFWKGKEAMVDFFGGEILAVSSVIPKLDNEDIYTELARRFGVSRETVKRAMLAVQYSSGKY